jgi:conjugative transfer signal peptidase TraF
MPDHRVPPDTHWVEELRALIEQRRRTRGRLAIASLTACAAVPLTASIAWKPPVLLVWNASASAPLGLYRLRPTAPVRRGDMVIAWTPRPARELAAARHYLPANVPLVKRVAAAAGDRVCAAGRAVSINGTRVAMRQRSDGAGRPMPWWSGCRRLGQREYFLLMDRRDSFDGRYFGVTRSEDLVGRTVLLWKR